MKIKLWRLIDAFIDHRIDEVQFCDEFYKSYNLGEIKEDFLEDEDMLFNSLSEVAGRFSEFESDHKKYPGLYYTKAELADKILETKQKLMKIHPEYFERE